MDDTRRAGQEPPWRGALASPGVIPTEYLNLLWLDVSQDKALTSSLRASLERLHGAEAYQHWLQGSCREPFALTRLAPGVDLEPLVRTGLAREGRLEVKVNRIDDRFFVTDGAWVSHVLRVFPDPDEAQLLLAHVRRRGLDTWADWVVDPAAGCGHTPLGFPGPARRVVCDANVRALLYASINARLNQLGPEQVVPLLNDMTAGFPPALKLDGNVLFLANVPFAVSARRGDLALNSAGGTTGADLQVASFQLVRRFQREHPVPVRACFLTWTVGSLARDEWEVPLLCRDLFSDRTVEWSLVQDDTYELPNPTPLAEAMRYLAASPYAVQSSTPELERTYAELTRQLEAQGHTHVAYGMLELL